MNETFNETLNQTAGSGAVAVNPVPYIIVVLLLVTAIAILWCAFIREEIQSSKDSEKLRAALKPVPKQQEHRHPDSEQPPKDWPPPPEKKDPPRNTGPKA